MWIEIGHMYYSTLKKMSRPARALWIEILPNDMVKDAVCVEAREGLVD